MCPRTESSIGTANLREEACQALQQAADFALALQQQDGHWVAPVLSDASFTTQYVLFKYATAPARLAADPDAPALKRWLLWNQDTEGAWGPAPGHPGDVSSSCEAYLALRVLGTPASDPALVRARTFIVEHGGMARSRFLSRIFFAAFGLIAWASVPQVPAELVLLPTWAPLNIYALPSWIRATLLPLLVVRHHEPLYALPNGRHVENGFLDELWPDPADKRVLPTLSEALWEPDGGVLRFLFTLGDKALAGLGGLQKAPTRRGALQRCIEWILDHQEEQGDWAGYLPPNWGCIWALLLEGLTTDDRPVHLALEALERFAISDEHGKWFQGTNSPCWDTAFMLGALSDAGRRDDARLAAAGRWLWSHQLMVEHGDWRVYAHTQQAGGWSFEYFNTHYPDLDDTAVVVMALVKQDPRAVAGEGIANAVEWILGMQNRDGGWGAFDIDNGQRYLNYSLVGDMDNLADPSTPDVTGRMLQCFGLLLYQQSGWRLCERLRPRVQASAARAVSFLLKNQEATGSWWSRWAVNYLNGTAYALWGLEKFCHNNPDARQAIVRSLHWLDARQNADGGWGESPLSYSDASLAGRGSSTPAQTAWVVDAMLRYRAPDHPAIEQGVRWLLSHRTGRPEDDRWASWPSDIFVGTGFPPILYLGYPYYHHHYPMEALARYIDSPGHHETGESLQLSPHVLAALQPLSVLMVAPGNRADVDASLCVADSLRGSRVRVAAQPEHRAAIEEHGFEFCDVDRGTNDDIDPSEKPLTVCWSAALSRPAHVIGYLRTRAQKLFQSGFDAELLATAVARCHGDWAKRLTSPQALPFVVDVVLSSPAATATHVHAAQNLHVPHVVVSTQAPPRVRPTATGDAPPLAGWWRRLAHTGLDLACILVALSLCLPTAIAHALAAPVLAARLQELLWRGRWDHAAPAPRRIGAGVDPAEAARLVHPQSFAACALIPALRAQWRHAPSALPLSGAAAAGLVERGALDWDELMLAPAPRLERAAWERGAGGWSSVLVRMAKGLGLALWAVRALSDRFVVTEREGESAQEDGTGLDGGDPVRTVRIRQGEFELDYIRRRVEEEEVGQIEEHLVQRWHGLAATKFRELFVEEGCEA